MTIGINIVHRYGEIIAPKKMLLQTAFETWDAFFIGFEIRFTSSYTFGRITAAVQIAIDDFAGISCFQTIGINDERYGDIRILLFLFFFFAAGRLVFVGAEIGIAKTGLTAQITRNGAVFRFVNIIRALCPGCKTVSKACGTVADTRFEAFIGWCTCFVACFVGFANTVAGGYITTIVTMFVSAADIFSECLEIVFICRLGTCFEATLFGWTLNGAHERIHCIASIVTEIRNGGSFRQIVCFLRAKGFFAGTLALGAAFKRNDERIPQFEL